MIIFQTAGGGNAGSFGASAALLRERGAPVATTFRSNEYIHRLNRALQAEMRAVSAYRGLGVRFDEAHAAHQDSGKELVRLIIANRGIPEDRTALSFGLTRTLIHLCNAMPARLGERATLGTLQKIEGHLVQSYKKLQTMAPSRDRPILDELLARTERQANALTNRR